MFLPLLDFEQRKIFLQSCDEASHILSIVEREKIRKILSSLGAGCARLPNTANQMTYNCLSGYGMSDMFSTFLSPDKETETNLSFAVQMASPSIVMAASIGATLIPIVNELVPIYKMLAELYSGVPTEKWIIEEPNYVNFAVEDLLVIGNNIPVLEFVKTFNDADIDRFREIVLGISQNVKSVDELGDNIETFNHFVKKYEEDKRIT